MLQKVAGSTWHRPSRWRPRPRLPLVETAIVADLDDAVAAAKRLGFPVALKGAGSSILHKTDLGAVKLSLVDEDAVIEAGSAMRERLGDGLEGFVVQSMSPSGVELLAGVATDPSFGPLVIFGAGELQRSS